MGKGVTCVPLTYAFPDTLIFIIVLYTCHLFNYYNFHQYCITGYYLLLFLSCVLYMRLRLGYSGQPYPTLKQKYIDCIVYCIVYNKECEIPLASVKKGNVEHIISKILAKRSLGTKWFKSTYLRSHSFLL